MAGPQGAAYRARKFVRTYWGAVVGTTAAVLLLMMGLFAVNSVLLATDLQLQFDWMLENVKLVAAVGSYWVTESIDRHPAIPWRQALRSDPDLGGRLRTLTTLGTAIVEIEVVDADTNEIL